MISYLTWAGSVLSTLGYHGDGAWAQLLIFKQCVKYTKKCPDITLGHFYFKLTFAKARADDIQNFLAGVIFIQGPFGVKPFENPVKGAI